MVETIYLKPLTTWEKMQKTREKLPLPLKVLTSLKTTAVLGATLGALLAPATALKTAKTVGKMVVPKSVKGAVGMAVGVPMVAGVLASSAKAREKVSKYLNPVENIKRGQKLGEIIESPEKAAEVLGLTGGEKTGFMDYLKAGAKTAGIAGLAVAGVAGATTLYKKYKEKKATEVVPGLTPSTVQQGLTANDKERAGVSLESPYVPFPSAVPPSISPVGSPQAPQMQKPITNIIQIQLR